MKKQLLLSLILIIMVSCGTDNFKEQLKQNVTTKANGMEVKYRLDSYQIIDSIYNIDMIDSLLKSLPVLDKEPILDEFIDERNKEFKTYRYLDPNYEAEVMTGKLKDASPWCTEIREITECADSIIKNWNNIDKYSYDYNRLYWWYLKRADSYFKFDYTLSAQIADMYNTVINSKDKFILLDSLKKLPSNELHEIKILHSYSIYNPLLQQRINLNEMAFFDKNGKLLRVENKDNLSDLFKQIQK